MSASYVDREKQLRSVFVGNIPFDVTEGELREKFEQAGPIVSFRLVHDRDSGKPKGYGFIEYQDTATANSCVRNLNNVEYNGRPLRVGPAAGGDQSSAENIKALQQALGGLQQESPYGAAVEPTEAPEAISKAVSSLPPEQMFELMKQMKLCIQNNPNEARSMLLQNPQLAYALLQAQIVMKIVDPQVAMALLHRERDAAPPLNTDETPKPVVPAPAPATDGGFRASGGLLGERPGESAPNRAGLLDGPHGMPPDRWAGGGSQGAPPGMDPRGPAAGMRGSDSMNHRGMYPRSAPPGMDSRGGPPGMDSRGGIPGLDPRTSSQNMDPRSGARGMDPRSGPQGADRRSGPAGMDPRGAPPGLDPRGGPSGLDPRGGPSGLDPRGGPSGLDPRGGPPGLESRGGPPGLESRGGPPGLDPRGGPPGLDPRGGPPGLDPRGGPPGLDSRGGPPGLDPRSRPGMDPRSGPPGMDSRGGPPGLDPRGGPQGMDPRREQRGPADMDSRGPHMDRRDSGPPSGQPRNQDMDFRAHERGRPSPEFNRGGGGLLDPPRGDGRPPAGPSRGGMPSSSQFSPRQGAPSSRPTAGAAVDEDKEKAALIMQVLQLTDEQIQQLPSDQRQSILVLKQQISRQQ